MRYGIIGTGAIGGYYGAKLAHAGQEVHFLLHSDYEYVKQHGLQVDSCDGSFHLDNVNVYQHSEDMPQCDVVLVGLKSVNNVKLQSLLPPLLHAKAASKREQSDARIDSAERERQRVGDGTSGMQARPKVKTLVVLIQNGIGVEEDVQKMFPDVQLAAGLAFICSAKTEPGLVSHQCYGSINLANYSCKDEAMMQAVVDDFRQAGIETGLVEYHEARWKKAVWNMPFNGMTVALHTQTDMLLKNKATRHLIREQMMEVVSAAQHLGVKNLDAAFVEKMITTTDAMTPYSPSMRLDYDFHRPMEIYYIYTRPLEIAREAGCPMPKLEMLEAELRFLEANPDICTTARLL
jgi:2-dehydropantoate 2-reductase